MQPQKKQPTVRAKLPKVVQELQPNKICKCGACEPRKPKLPIGQRRLKVSSKLVVHQRAWVKEDSVYDYVPKLDLKDSGYETLDLKLGNI